MTNPKNLSNADWIKNILIAIDQLLNAVFKGDPDSTISARTGFHAVHAPRSAFWRRMQRVINLAFRPVDGEGHCRQAWEADPNEWFYDVKGIPRLFLFITTFLLCLVIGVILWSAYFVSWVKHQL